MCIMYSTLRDAKTPYTKRWQTFKDERQTLKKISKWL
jgi:hypothetical protein